MGGRLTYLSQNSLSSKPLDAMQGQTRMRNDGKRIQIQGVSERRLRKIASKTGRHLATLPGIHLSPRD